MTCSVRYGRPVGPDRTGAISADQERTRSSVQLHFVIGLVSRQFLMAVGRARFRRPPTPAGRACGRTTLTRDGGRPSSAPRKGPRTRAAEPDLTDKTHSVINNWIRN